MLSVHSVRCDQNGTGQPTFTVVLTTRAGQVTAGDLY